MGGGNGTPDDAWLAVRRAALAPPRGRGSDDGDNESTGRLGLALAAPCVVGGLGVGRGSAGAAPAPALQGAPRWLRRRRRRIAECDRLGWGDVVYWCSSGHPGPGALRVCLISYSEN